MTEFDMTGTQKLFITGMWVGSLAITALLVLWDIVTGRKPDARRRPV